MSLSFIKLYGCKEHNLKNLTLQIPKGKITVVTGVSGSGKSSLAFDTLFTEGERRYLQHLSIDTKKAIKLKPQPNLDWIEGLSPTIAIGQKRRELYSFGSIATYTEIYDFLCLLYARIGQQHSPESGKRLIRYSRQEIIDRIARDYPLGTRLLLIAPIKLDLETVEEAITRLQQMGFIRFKINDAPWTIDDPLPQMSEKIHLDVIVDRLEIKEGIRERLAPSIETALDLSKGIIKIERMSGEPVDFFTEVYLCPETGLSFAPLQPADFNFNSPKGRCPRCHGRGKLENQVLCPVCEGRRLKPESLACFVQGMAIDRFCHQTVGEALSLVESWVFSEKEKKIAEELLPEIKTRLHFLEEIGLTYLRLERSGKSLSEGEKQRIQLTSKIGAKLSGLIYVLDEPSLGLHSDDMKGLKKLLQSLKALGNTLLVVEHEPSLMQEADYLIELGPGAGIHGGELIFEGSYAEMVKSESSLTGAWLSGKKKFPLSKKKRAKKLFLEVSTKLPYHEETLSFKIPLGCLVAFCGVSGSGKSTLLIDKIGEPLKQFFANRALPSDLKGYESIQRVSMEEKRNSMPSARSIPATYVHLMKPLRDLFAATRLAKARGYSAARFSLHKPGGRCEACQGLGEKCIKMEFMSDLYLPCEVCKGSRYNYETLQVLWQTLSFADVLALSVEKAAEIFRTIPPLYSILALMMELGLGYLTLGQPCHTLSGGEIQRLKLTGDLASKTALKTLYILDEPSAGLHFEDVSKLLKIFHHLIDQGHSVLFIEHDLALIEQADWVIEMGPQGGDLGGKIIFQGEPQKLIQSKTATGRALNKK